MVLIRFVKLCFTNSSLKSENPELLSNCNSGVGDSYVMFKKSDSVHNFANHISLLYIEIFLTIGEAIHEAKKAIERIIAFILLALN